MKVWRKALTEVRSAAQLAMCIQQLQKSIAWERSIMKVVSSRKKTAQQLNTNYLLRRCILDLMDALVFFSTVKCAGRGITRTSSCCVMAVTKAAILTVTNPRSPVSQRETGTARPAYLRYQSLLLYNTFPSLYSESIINCMFVHMPFTPSESIHMKKQNRYFCHKAVRGRYPWGFLVYYFIKCFGAFYAFILKWKVERYSE